MTSQVHALRTAAQPFYRWLRRRIRNHPKVRGALLRHVPGVLRIAGAFGYGLSIGRMEYADWVHSFDTLGDADRIAIRAHVAALERRPLISVVMPVYNPPAEMLRRAITSVQNQLYPDWGLCIADDASPSPDVVRTLAELTDPRIHVVRRAENGHISAATNTALDLASGEFVALMDHDDILAEHALYEVAVAHNARPDVKVFYSDEDKMDGTKGRFYPYFKPDFDPDLLLAQNMVSHLGVYSRALIEQVGGLRVGFEGSQDHDLALRTTHACGAASVQHIPVVLYHWRQPENAEETFSQRHVERCWQAGHRAVEEHMVRLGQADAKVVRPGDLPWHRVIWPLPDPPPLVTVIVPTRDRPELLEKCLSGVLQRTDYTRLEVIVVDNGSVLPATAKLFERLEQDPRVRILSFPGPFNYAAMNNAAVRAAQGDILLLLNNDIEVIEPGWLGEMVRQAVRPEVGAVGARLLYADGTLQHGGVVLGVGGVANHFYAHASRNENGNMGSLALVHRVSAVTGACLAVRKSIFDEVGGLDEAGLAVAFNDVDLCLRIRALGYANLWTPHAELYHLESASRGDDLRPAQRERFMREVRVMLDRWGPELVTDPFYNPNCSLSGSDYTPGAPRRPRSWAAWLPEADPAADPGSRPTASSVSAAGVSVLRI